VALGLGTEKMEEGAAKNEEEATRIADRITWRTTIYKRLFRVLEDNDVQWGSGDEEAMKKEKEHLIKKRDEEMDAIKKELVVTKDDLRRWSGEPTKYLGMEARLKTDDMLKKKTLLAAMQEHFDVMNHVDKGLSVLQAGMGIRIQMKS
jgi:hypothetical protein